MLLQNMKRIIDNHGIETKLEGTKLIAKDEQVVNGELVVQWLDVTKWTTEQVKKWLGY